MTILHWFESECEPHEIAEKTELALRAIGPVVVKATTEDLFGPNHDIPVTRLAKDPSLVQLHSNIKNAMEELGTVFDSRWTGETRWNLHVTHKPDNRLYSGNTVHVTDIDLITRPHKDGDRTILQRFELGS